MSSIIIYQHLIVNLRRSLGLVYLFGFIFTACGTQCWRREHDDSGESDLFYYLLNIMILKNLFHSVTKQHAEQKILPTHPLHLFRIIQDVDKYQTFLPLCNYSKVIRRSPDGRSFDGRLQIGSKYFSEEYVSRVTVIPEKYTIETKSIESTRFEALRSRWKLGEIQNEGEDIHCKVDFEVEMTVKDPVIVAVLDQILEQIASRQVEAFEKRCHELPIDYDLINSAKNFRQ